MFSLDAIMAFYKCHLLLPAQLIFLNKQIICLSFVVATICLIAVRIAANYLCTDTGNQCSFSFDKQLAPLPKMLLSVFSKHFLDKI